ncbi:hypothetical protein M072_3092 [Bacteroides fragilis str. DS-208]|nr:hypothetical protein M072_3092 [Bacteroides fragilis str. DS-208]
MTYTHENKHFFIARKLMPGKRRFRRSPVKYDFFTRLLQTGFLSTDSLLYPESQFHICTQLSSQDAYADN